MEPKLDKDPTTQRLDEIQGEITYHIRPGSNLPVHLRTVVVALWEVSDHIKDETSPRYKNAYEQKRYEWICKLRDSQNQIADRIADLVEERMYLEGDYYEDLAA